jgi:hypothetical protein
MTEPLKLVLGYIVATLSALGYGLLTAWLANRSAKPDSSQPNYNLAGDGVIGVAILTTLFMMIHFFVALRQTADLLILAPGVLCFAFFFRRRFLFELPILAVMVWWAFQLSRSGPASWDHGLYHLQSTMWNTLEPVIPGLANLHARLGFNSSVFVFAAGLEIPLLGAWHLALVSSTIIEAMIVTELLLAIRSSPQKVARLYCFIVVAFLIFVPRWLILFSYISPDSVVVMGTLYAILLYLEKRNTALLLLLPYLITVKLVVLPLVLLLDWKPSLNKYQIATAIGTAFLLIWVARNVVLSGHLLFPVSATRLPVSWAVSEARTQDTANWITSWGRAPGKTLQETSGSSWIRPWITRMTQNEQVRIAIAISVIGAFFLIWKKAFRQLNWRLISVIALALLFWFSSAPDPRFGTGFIFGAGFLILAYGLDSIDLLRLDASNTWVVIAILFIGLGWMANSEHNLVWPSMMPPKVRLAITTTGDRIWAPVPLEDRCWALVPCAPDGESIRYYPERALKRAPTP